MNQYEVTVYLTRPDGDFRESKIIEASRAEITESDGLNFWRVVPDGLELVAAYAPLAWHDVKKLGYEEPITGTGEATGDASSED